MSEQQENLSAEISEAQEESLRESAFRNKPRKNTRVRFDAENIDNDEAESLTEETLVEDSLKKPVSFYIQDEIETEMLSDNSTIKEPCSSTILPRCMSENLSEMQLNLSSASPTLDSQDPNQRLDMSPHSLYNTQHSELPTIQLMNLSQAASSSSFLHTEAHATFSNIPGAFDPETCMSSNQSLGQEDGEYRERLGGRHGKEFYSLMKYAYELVRTHLRGGMYWQKKVLKGDSGISNHMACTSESISASSKFRGGVLSHLLKLYNHPDNIYLNRQNQTMTPPGTGRSTPKLHNKSANSSSTSLSALLATSSATVAMPNLLGLQHEDSILGFSRTARPFYKSRKHSTGIANAIKHTLSRSRFEDEIRITVHLADVLQRQKFILRLCRALMLYGSPTHRLEECMKLTSKVLEINGQFLYIPGCMIVSFGDLITHTTDMHLIRVNQGLDIGKLQETHCIYKQVIHDLIGVEEAMKSLDEVLNRKQYYGNWIIILFYGFASALVGPFAFNASWVDMPISFVLGCILGVLKIVVAQRSLLYANAFEISATVITSFLSRAFGSIRDQRHNGKYIFCFPSMAESSIALILPGYLVLCGSLELQTKNIVAGSVRLFYAIIYSLFLGFGITIGSVIYKSMDRTATNETQCHSNINILFRFLSVPIFTACILVVNQAKPKQFPVALIIATAGYIVNFFSAKRFGASQVSNAIGAFLIGCLGNVYSRIGHGLAFTVVLPAIFVQIPSGLAAQRGVYIGIGESNEIFIGNASQNAASNSTTTQMSDPNSLSFGIVMIQISIAITVGLFFSSILIYSFGGIKKRSALFSL
ncbi:hypothetical protein PCANB_000038 [Pneumocystis canis]|nr:hypothetical protein PCK1_000148 [Pneumocystis canis]KAG5439756.1 hypothetical protein PCANB_000038 [Pneumocystis canis]